MYGLVTKSALLYLPCLEEKMEVSHSKAETNHSTDLTPLTVSRWCECQPFSLAKLASQRFYLNVKCCKMKPSCVTKLRLNDLVLVREVTFLFSL